ncbi:hypothetical protein MUO74_11315 [Candidatus Bathyarchaeota archaeon]|jgi:hypothetical protein|nr:hypothetical protein [Candidatus Bathyarchaeota archaeon]
MNGVAGTNRSMVSVDEYSGTINVVVMLSAGLILSAFYVRSQDRIGERFKRKVEEIETQHPDS